MAHVGWSSWGWANELALIRGQVAAVDGRIRGRVMGKHVNRVADAGCLVSTGLGVVIFFVIRSEDLGDDVVSP